MRAIIVLCLLYLVYLFYSTRDIVNFTSEITQCVADIPIWNKEGDYINKSERQELLISIYNKIYNIIETDYTQRYSWKLHGDTWILISENFSYGTHRVVDDIIPSLLEVDW